MVVLLVPLQNIYLNKSTKQKMNFKNVRQSAIALRERGAAQGAEWALLAAKNLQPPWLTLQPPDWKCQNPPLVLVMLKYEQDVDV